MGLFDRLTKATDRPDLVPQGGVIKEFTEAATDALHEAARWKPGKPVPGYNIYLDEHLHLVGIDSPLEWKNLRKAAKQGFAHSTRVRWAVSFMPEAKKATVRHRSGYICHFQKA